MEVEDQPRGKDMAVVEQRHEESIALCGAALRKKNRPVWSSVAKEESPCVEQRRDRRNACFEQRRKRCNACLQRHPDRTAPRQNSARTEQCRDRTAPGQNSARTERRPDRTRRDRTASGQNGARTERRPDRTAPRQNGVPGETPPLKNSRAEEIPRPYWKTRVRAITRIPP
jgi:hypothetical protein